MPMRRLSLPRFGFLLCAPLACALTACTGSLNHADGPLGVELPALRGSSPTIAQPERTDAPSLARDERAPWSSRGGWTVVPVELPGAEVETQPAYRTHVPSRHASSPAQIATAPAHAAIDLVLLGPRMVATPPGTTVRAPKPATKPASTTASESASKSSSESSPTSASSAEAAR